MMKKTVNGLINTRVHKLFIANENYHERPDANQEDIFLSPDRMGFQAGQGLYPVRECYPACKLWLHIS